MLNKILDVKLKQSTSGFTKELNRLHTTGKLLIGVVGGIGSGKSTFCSNAEKHAKSKDLKIHHINMDALGHIILSEVKNSKPAYTGIRSQLAKIFGKSIQNEDGSINRKILGEQVFHDKTKLDKLTSIMMEPILLLLEEKINLLSPGVVLIESAILLERNLSWLVDDNIIQIHVSPETQIERMNKFRNLTKEQAKKRLESQTTSDQTFELIKAKQQNNLDRLYLRVDSSKDIEFADIYKFLEKQYFFRFNSARYEHLFIPSNLIFDNNNELNSLLTTAYSHKDRHYHNLEHIQEMLIEYQRIRHLFNNPLEVYLAIIFHDFIYDVSSKTNEKDSAAVAIAYLKEHLINVQDVDLKLLERLIVLTASHGSIEYNLSNDEKLFLDMDMSILGNTFRRFKQFELGVGKEYQTIYPKEIYLKGRIIFLQNVLKNKPIYLSNHYNTRLEKLAVANIQKILSELKTGYPAN